MDLVQAASWFQKAANQGSAVGQVNLGFCYSQGDGVEMDLVQAASWFQKAADQGHPPGQYALGLCYANGEGVAKNSVKALVYFIKAAQQNHESARARLRLPTQGWYPQLHGVFFPPACHTATWVTLLAARRFAVELPEELWREGILPCWRLADFQ
jgi:TPR repeat protein